MTYRAIAPELTRISATLTPFTSRTKIAMQKAQRNAVLATYAATQASPP